MTSFFLGANLSFYVGRIYMRWIMITGGVFFTLMTLFDFTETLRRASSKNLPMRKLLEVVFLHVPFLLEQVLPFIVLFATLLTLWQLNRSQEIVILKSAGSSMLQILSPLLVIAFTIGAVDTLVVNHWSADFMGRYEKLNRKYFQGAQDQVVITETGLWMRDKVAGHAAILRIGKVIPTNLTLEDVSVIQFKEEDVFLAPGSAPRAFGSLRPHAYDPSVGATP